MNIIEMARQADLDWARGWTLDDDEPNRFEVFAHLVEAAARADEREACANLCETMDSTSDYYGLRVELACADAIRERGTT